MFSRERKEVWFNPKHSAGGGGRVKALLQDPTMGQCGEDRKVSADWSDHGGFGLGYFLR